MKHQISIVVAVLPSLLCISKAQAQPPIQSSSFGIESSMEIAVLQNDNIFQRPDNQTSSKIGIINPQIQLTLRDRLNSYSAGAEISAGRYYSSETDNYTDWSTNATAHLELSTRNKLDLNASLSSTQETRGSGFSEGGDLPDTPDKYELLNYGFNYQFGTDNSRGRLELDLSKRDRTYTNNRLTTFARDNENTTINPTFYLNVLSKADLLLEYRYTDLSYKTLDATGNSLDSIEKFTFIGFQWRATSKTSGSVRVGQGKKLFDSAAREDSDIPSWEVDLQWSPLTYSVFTLGATRSFEETIGTGDALKTKNYNLNWSHDWSSRVNSTLRYLLDKRSFAGDLREDDSGTATLDINYSLRNWLDINVSYSYEDQESNSALFNYTQQIVSIGIQANL